MKKVLKVSTCLILALVMVFGVSVAAFAASKSDVVEIVKAVDANGAEVTTTLGEVSGAPLLTEEIAAEEIGNVEAKELTVLWQKEVTASALPATLTFEASGVSADQNIYVFHYNGTKWELVASGKGATIAATFESLSPVGIVAQNATNQGTTDQTTTPTGDNSHVALWGILMVVAACGAVGTIVYSKKRRTN